MVPPVDRDPITGPLGVELCGGDGGGALVGFGAEVGCGWLGAGPFGAAEVEACDAAELAACESLIAPSLGRSPGTPPWAIGAPLGRSPVLAASVAALEGLEAVVFVSGPAGGPAVLLLQAAQKAAQNAQTRAAATAVAAALAGATVPRIGMDATVAK